MLAGHNGHAGGAAVFCSLFFERQWGRQANCWRISWLNACGWRGYPRENYGRPRPAINARIDGSQFADPLRVGIDERKCAGSQHLYLDPWYKRSSRIVRLFIRSIVVVVNVKMPCHAETIFTPSLPNCSPDVCAVNADEKTSSNGIVRPWPRLSSLEVIASCPEGKLAPSFIRMRKGMLGSRANQNRHCPIKYWMFGRDGIQAISSWVCNFKNQLYPWGGMYRFKDGASCEDGPVYSASLE